MSAKIQQILNLKILTKFLTKFPIKNLIKNLIKTLIKILTKFLIKSLIKNLRKKKYHHNLYQDPQKIRYKALIRKKALNRYKALNRKKAKNHTGALYEDVVLIICEKNIMRYLKYFFFCIIYDLVIFIFGVFWVVYFSVFFLENYLKNAQKL